MSTGFNSSFLRAHCEDVCQCADMSICNRKVQNHDESRAAFSLTSKSSVATAQCRQRSVSHIVSHGKGIQAMQPNWLLQQFAQQS